MENGNIPPRDPPRGVRPPCGPRVHLLEGLWTKTELALKGQSEKKQHRHDMTRVNELFTVEQRADIVVRVCRRLVFVP